MLGGVTRRMLPHLSGVLHLYSETGPKTQTANYCFHYANENVTTIVTLFSNLKTIVRSLHFTLPQSCNAKQRREQ